MRKGIMLVGILMLAGLVSLVSAQTPLSWTATSTLPVGTKDGVLLEADGYMYLLGGRTETDPNANDDCYYAPINTDGSIGTWQSTTAFPGNRACHGGHVYDGYIYAWGGWKEDWPTMNTCWYAEIQGDGSIGTWNASSVTIPDSGTGESQMDSFGRGTLGLGKYLYIFGGEMNDATKSRDCYYSEIQTNHDYGAWVETTQLPEPEGADGYWFHGTAIYDGETNDYVYQVGGNHSGTTESEIIYNTIESDGSLGDAWTISPYELNVACYELGCAIFSNYIFAVGGLAGSDPLPNVQRITINPLNGAVVDVSDDTALPLGEGEGRARTHAIFYDAGGKHYIANVGGAVYAGTPYYDTCFYSEFVTPTPTPIPQSVRSDWAKYE